MDDISLPSKIEFSTLEKDNAELLVEPLFPGYGLTIANSLRRVLLSSLPGSAVCAVKIKGVNHEFSTIPNVKEDVVEIILSLKKLNLKVHSDERVKLELKVKGQKKVLASDIKAPSNVEIMNKDLFIANLTSKDSDLEMEIWAEQGRGFLPVEARDKENFEIGTMAIDSVFTPVKKVSYKIENVRVGQMTDYDKVIMKVETDGTVTPKEAVDKAAEILVNHFSLFTDVKKQVKKVEKKEEPKEKIKEAKKVKFEGEDTSVEDLKLTTRTTNALYGSGLRKLSDVVSKASDELLELSGFGETALKEIRKVLKKRGLKLKGDE